MADTARVTNKGARRWAGGHPWIYRSDVTERPGSPAGAVMVEDNRNRKLGWALWSPASEISLRMIERDPEVAIDGAWWRTQIERAAARRSGMHANVNAYRLIHGEGDGCPSLICDRYDRWLVVQMMSAGLEAFRNEIVAALLDVTKAEGILARNDVPLRSKEGLERNTELLHGDVPREIVVEEYGVKFIVAPWSGQKTGAFLDQRENRRRVGELARGRALDCFSYHGSFALHLAAKADEVLAVDSSGQALVRAAENAKLNGFENIRYVEADAFDHLRELERTGERFDTIVLDPPAFAKSKTHLAGALRGYKDVNLLGMKLLARGGRLYTASCSFHLTKPLFLEMLQEAAAESGRTIAFREFLGQPLDHPEILSIPETGYLKGALLEAMD
ncbi:MAG: class I SAM-dependent rRNA methyltransferase [Gemmatimonadaceae bacterium]|nr:class I SAM-dependent rRNA methyltransferase [Gemmatimonadaceae bacterium]